MSKLVFRVFPCLLGLLLIFSAGLQAQSVFGTITGTVTDASGSVVARANVTATNTASGDIRRSVTNSDGYYTFSSVPAGSYSITVDAPGFQKAEQTGLNLLGAETRKADFTLQVGTSKAEVTITSSADIVGTVDSGEKASVLTTKQLQDFSVVGRSAAEFIKILPGFASIGSGVQNKPGYNGEVIGINGNGEGGKQSAIGNYSANGLGAASIDITADGSHVSDPGCNCASPVNPNTDMIQEFKVMTSNFSAENSKGPVVMNSIAKSGGRDYHGEAYLYARHYAMNANDYENNKLGLVKPANKYFFPGGQIGGPVLIPGTGFNKNRDKLFFFTAFEYYKQTLDTGLVTSNVPSAGERIGDFSSDLASLTSAAAGGNTAAQAFIKNYPNGIIPAGSVDPTGKALSSLYPLPNANPAQTQGFNFAKQYNVNQNSYQSLSRVDYSISDNTKLFVRYNLQNELQQFPIGLWWRNSGQVPYPTPIDAHNTSQSVSASLTHVFNPTLTNEAVVGYTYINFPNSFEDAKKVDRTALGIPFTGIYHNGVKQIPSITSWGSGVGAIFNPGGFEKGNGTLFATKYLPSFSDTLTKVAGTHTIKFGYYWEHIINNQPANNNTNGLIVEAPWAGGSTGNTFADLILGNAAQYSESNLNPLHNEAYTIHEGFVQDSWKTTRRLTLELGLRASYLGNWTDRQGVGFSVWAPNTYTNTPAAPTAYDGVLWHARNKSVPLSGYNQKPIFLAPRFGLAYDVFGTGKTVIRGGWGAFRYHTPQFTNGLDVGFGVLNFSQNSLLSFSQLQQLTPTSATSGRQTLNVLDQKQSEQPLTYSWSFTISQRTFGHSLFEASYVGNSSQYLPDSGGTFNNVNAVPYGTFLGNGNVSNDAYDAARPLLNYQDLNVARNNLYANYHSLQLSWVRQSGRWNYQVNYTYGKALGIAGNANRLNLNDNYGPTANDRRHVFNAAYSYELPNVIKDGNALLKGVMNGWQISGITQFSTGQNLEQNGNQNFNLQTGDYLPNFNPTYINGTGSIDLHPIVTCNPTKGLAKNQYINGNCFAAPTPGHNGPSVLPEVFGPAFFDSDLSIFKNLQMGESRRLQFRFSAYNFLNHPINSFIDSSANNLTLKLGKDGKNENKDYGITTDKFGHRTIQLAVKFYF